MTTDITVMARLEVPREPLVAEIKRVVKVLGRRTTAQAIVSFADGQMNVLVGGAEFSVPATGRWPGEARASPAWITALAKVPPAKDPVIVQVKGGRLHVASLSMQCHWQRTDSVEVGLPLNATLIDTLRLALQNDETALERSGLSGPVLSASQAATSCIDKAMVHMKLLGVSREDLEALVVRSIIGSVKTP